MEDKVSPHLLHSGPNPQPWTATLRPNRSMSRRGITVLIALVALINLGPGLYLWAIGAWPVVGFMGLDVLLLWWALRRSWADGEVLEQICIEGDAVTLTRHPLRGAVQAQAFNRRWLRVDLEVDEARELIGRLFFLYRGERHEIGAFLGADDRQSLAQALRAALRAT